MALFKNKFESAKQDWTTPIELFKKLNEEFNFTVDLAASSDNTLVKTSYFSIEDDALNKDWIGCGWLNPPYGSSGKYKLQNWVKKAFEDTQKFDSIVVMLIPARTNTKWWHDYCMKAAEVRFISGRPKFGDAKFGLPQPMAIIVFNSKRNQTIFSTFNLP